jgi:hypothetical protein
MNILKNNLGIAIVALGLMLAGGAVAGATAIASAETATTSTGSAVQSAVPKMHGHSPLGGDGIVASISGTTIVMTEESDEGGASYTIDASKASVTNNGAAGSISDINVGEKIFVQGTVSGTNVAATSISVGHPGEWMHKGNDSDGGATNEASEPASSSDAAE